MAEIDPQVKQKIAEQLRRNREHYLDLLMQGNWGNMHFATARLVSEMSGSDREKLQQLYRLMRSDIDEHGDAAVLKYQHNFVELMQGDQQRGSLMLFMHAARAKVELYTTRLVSETLVGPTGHGAAHMAKLREHLEQEVLVKHGGLSLGQAERLLSNFDEAVTSMVHGVMQDPGRYPAPPLPPPANDNLSVTQALKKSSRLFYDILIKNNPLDAIMERASAGYNALQPTAEQQVHLHDFLAMIDNGTAAWDRATIDRLSKEMARFAGIDEQLAHDLFVARIVSVALGDHITHLAEPNDTPGIDDMRQRSADALEAVLANYAGLGSKLATIIIGRMEAAATKVIDGVRSPGAGIS